MPDSSLNLEVAPQMSSQIVSVSESPSHSFSKPCVSQVTLLEGFGVANDAHCGVTVKHRSRVAQDPSQPNLRQVHLIPAELFEELELKGFHVRPGELGENVTTRGVDLLALPVGALLRLGASAVVRVTGLRNPCVQLDQFRPGLMSALIERNAQGALVLKAGVMGVVEAGGIVSAGDAIAVELPLQPHRRLERV